MRNLKNGKWMYNLGKVVASLALMITAFNVNTTCVYIAHQKKIPDSAKRFRKF